MPTSSKIMHTKLQITVIHSFNIKMKYGKCAKWMVLNTALGAGMQLTIKL